MWTVRNPQVDWPIIGEIEAADDRAAVIVAVSLIEDRLAATIKTCLHCHDKDAVAAMFEGMGPLRNFSAQVRLGFLIGIYGEAMRDTLNQLGRIRNRFAHELNVNSFAHPRVNGLVNNLNTDPIITSIKHESIKNAFVGSSLGASPAKDRKLFVATIQVTLLLLELFRSYAHKPHQPLF
jgi:DNA-binding MltR family transcriptional regulator